jgi:endonuclease III
MTSNPIADEMLRYVPPPVIGQRSPGRSFREWEISEESKKLYEKSPDAFLMAAILSKQIRGHQAYEIPLRLMQRMGHLDVRRISEMSREELAGYMGPGKHGKALHRFYNTMSDQLIFDCGLIVAKYGGRAVNIWKDERDAGTVITRLQELKGVSQKISNMFVRHLVTDYGVSLDGRDRIDIAVDRHVARVFLRTGLVGSKKGQDKYHVSEIAEEVVDRARELYPHYPAALDVPAFNIGYTWCTEKEARCAGSASEGPCPLSKVCTKRKRHYKIIG